MESGLLCFSFNQDYSYFACGTTSGFKVFNTNPLKENEKWEFREGGVGCVDMFYKCQYLAFVGGGHVPAFPRNKVMIWDACVRKVVVELPFCSDVLDVRLCEKHIVVVCIDRIKLLTFSLKPKRLHEYETYENPAGICQVSSSRSDVTVLCYPSKFLGQIHLVRLDETYESPKIIHAHESEIACLALNRCGARLATASRKGTLIRIFDTKTGEKLRELRRGASTAMIYCMNFNNNSTMLCVSSDHGTIHIFACGEQTDAAPQSFLTQLSSMYTQFLPTSLTSEWSFCQLRISAYKNCICAFGSEPDSVIAVCGDGNYYQFSFKESGEYVTTATACFHDADSTDATCDDDNCDGAESGSFTFFSVH